MPKVANQQKRTVWVCSIVFGTAIVIIALLILREDPIFEDLAFLGAFIMMFPPAIVDYMESRWKKSIDERLPDLFRGIVQCQQTGMSVLRALEEASTRDYGPLSAELKKMLNQMSWGMSFEDALEDFGKRTGTPLVQKAVPLIIEASRSGGNVEKVFAPLGKFVQASLMLEKERKAQTRPYIAIIYVAFFVFIFTIVLLFKTFFAEVDDSPISSFATLTSEGAWDIFFHMSSIQAVFGGLVAGKMGEGNISAGLKHSVVLIVSGYFALRIAAW
ncbi:MAG: type II secretion system F family protein [Candidatus Bathyarchaeota archaeon]|nr:MAG: type II secretion system F family protein [Candidatus Bathyarchaeota archaeon]